MQPDNVELVHSMFRTAYFFNDGAICLDVSKASEIRYKNDVEYFPYITSIAVDLQTQPQLQNDQQDSEGGCMC